jgi:hypothetical protein
MQFATLPSQTRREPPCAKENATTELLTCSIFACRTSRPAWIMCACREITGTMGLSGENFRLYCPTVPSGWSRPGSCNPSPKHIHGPRIPIAVTVTTDARRTNAGLTAVSRIGLSLVLKGQEAT